MWLWLPSHTAQYTNRLISLRNYCYAPLTVTDKADPLSILLSFLEIAEQETWNATRKSLQDRIGVTVTCLFIGASLGTTLELLTLYANRWTSCFPRASHSTKLDCIHGSRHIRPSLSSWSSHAYPSKKALRGFTTVHSTWQYTHFKPPFHSWNIC